MGWGSQMGRSNPQRGYVLFGPGETKGEGDPVVTLRKVVREDGKVTVDKEITLGVGDTISLTFRDVLKDEPRDVHHEIETTTTYEVL